MGSDIQVYELTKKMLLHSLSEHSFWGNSLIPFPKSKLHWIANNERIADDDYCLLVITSDNKIASFIYLLPDLMNLKDGSHKKIYWLISWWLHKDFKDTILGSFLFNRAMELADNKILIKFYAEHIAEFYNKLPFQQIASRYRYTLFFSLDSDMIIGKFRFLGKFKSLLKIPDYFSRSLYRFINKKKLSHHSKVKFEYLSKIDDSTWDFLKENCKNDLIYKTRSYVDWQIDNSQYTQILNSHNHLYRSIETGMSPNIYVHNIKIVEDNTVIGFISFIHNFNECNIKYFVVQEGAGYYENCVSVLIDNFIKTGATYIFTDDSILAETIKKKFSTVYTHKVIKKGLAHKQIDLKPEDYHTMLDRDGHFY